LPRAVRELAHTLAVELRRVEHGERRAQRRVDRATQALEHGRDVRAGARLALFLRLLHLSLELLDALQEFLGLRLQALRSLAQDPALALHLLDGGGTGERLDAPHTGLDRALREHEERPDVARR